MDNTVKVWNVTTGECLRTLTGHTSLVGLLGTSPNFLVSAAADASLRVWDANTHELKHTLASHSGAITCFQHDETKVVSGSDGTLKLWDIRTGQYVRDLVIGISSVWQVAFHGNLLVAASNRGGSTVFDVFDFGTVEHPSGMDDDKLDSLRRPPWERLNPREPREYQVDDIDGVEMTSPRDLPSPDVYDRYIRETSYSRGTGGHGSRRSSRLAARSVGNASLRNVYSIETHFRNKRMARGIDSSPTPAGPSGSSSRIRMGGQDMTGESFAPIFDEERGDESMMDEDVKEEIM